MGVIPPLIAECQIRHPRSNIPIRLLQQPVARALGIELTHEKNATAVKAIANAKWMGPGGLPVDLLKVRLKQTQTLLLELHRFITLIWCEG